MPAPIVRVRACAPSELRPGEAIQVPTVPPIAVFNVDGDFYATDDTCTHELSSLTDGYLEGDEVECSWHFARFCVRTGEARCLPATKALRTFSVMADESGVYVEVDDGRPTTP